MPYVASKKGSKDSIDPTTANRSVMPIKPNFHPNRNKTLPFLDVLPIVKTFSIGTGYISLLLPFHGISVGFRSILNSRQSDALLILQQYRIWYVPVFVLHRFHLICLDCFDAL
ncbi:hypothetical protein VNO78_11977 [Psophocarpus tetragonolobus]|uniref:Uncharacterized protein n=1 Tax=Psophocarpus tetragonolobus TaxID=3891 RepID=A0AAN9XP25_PSOTE